MSPEQLEDARQKQSVVELCEVSCNDTRSPHHCDGVGYLTSQHGRGRPRSHR